MESVTPRCDMVRLKMPANGPFGHKCMRKAIWFQGQYFFCAECYKVASEGRFSQTRSTLPRHGTGPIIAGYGNYEPNNN